MISKKAQVSTAIIFFIAFLSIALIFGVMAPIGANFNTKMYEAGEDILNDAIADLDGIESDEVRNTLNNTLTGASANAINNIEVNANLFKYSWVFMLGILGLIFFIFTRRSVELGSGLV